MTSSGGTRVWPVLWRGLGGQGGARVTRASAGARARPGARRRQRHPRRRDRHTRVAQDSRGRHPLRRGATAKSRRPPDRADDVAGAIVALSRPAAVDQRERDRGRRRRGRGGRKVGWPPPASSFSAKRPASASGVSKSNGPEGAAPPEPRRAGGDVRDRVPRRQPQRGGRPHRIHSPTRAPHVQGYARVRPRPGAPPSPAVLESIGARFNATTWFDRTNYYETIPSDRAGRRREDRSVANAACAPARRGPSAGDDRGAQRVRARRELAVPSALQAAVRDRVPRAPVPPPDDRMEQRHRRRVDRPSEGVLRHSSTTRTTRPRWSSATSTRT